MKKLIFAATIVSLLCSSVALATDQRANALMYNLGLEDDTDMFLFPHLANEYTGLYFDAPPNYTDAFGGAVFEVGSAHLGIFINRPTDRVLDRYRMQVTSNPVNLQGRFQGGDSPNGGQNFTRNDGQPIQFIADFGGWAMSARVRMWPGGGGGGGGLGDLLGGGANDSVLEGSDGSDESISFEVEATDDAPADVLDALEGGLTQESGNAEANSAMGIDLGFSWEMGSKTDAGVDLGYASYTDVGSEINFDFNMRHWGEDSTVLVSALQVGLWSPEDGDGDYFIGAPVKYGWVFSEDNDKLKAAVLTGADLQVSKAGEGDPNIGIGIPVVEVAAEYRVLDWMYVRSGVKGGFGMKVTGNEGYSDLDKMTNYEQTEFNSGVGFQWDRFVVDASVSYSTLTSGPHFIGGQSGGPFFGGISLAYMFEGGPEAAAAPAAN